MTTAESVGLIVPVWLIALGLQFAAPMAAPLAAWPALAGALALAARRHLGPGGRIAAVVLGVLACAHTLGLAHFVFVGLGWTLPMAPAGLVPLALAPLACLWAAGARGRAGAACGLACLVLALACAGWLRFGPHASAQAPSPAQIYYAADADTGDFHLVSPQTTPSDWARNAMQMHGGDIEASTQPALWLPRTLRAPAAAVRLPDVIVTPSSLPDGRMAITLRTDTDVRELRLTLEGADTLSDLEIQGVPLPPPPAGEPLRLRWSGPATGLALSLRMTGGTPRLLWAALTDDWPDDARPLPRRPAHLTTWGASDTLVMTGSLDLASEAP